MIIGVNMKILGICGSPRDGATSFLLKKALDELEKEDQQEAFKVVKL